MSPGAEREHFDMLPFIAILWVSSYAGAEPCVSPSEVEGVRGGLNRTTATSRPGLKCSRAMA